MENENSVVYPFGPPLGKFVVPREHVDFVNEYVQYITDNQLQDAHDHSARLVGRVKQEISFSRIEGFEGKYDSFIVCIDDLVKSYFSQSFKKHGKVVGPASRDFIEIEERDIWIVRQFSGDYNPMHNHSRFDISGVLYTIVPDEISSEKPPRQKGGTDGTIDFMSGAQGFLCNATHNVRPKENMLLLFPSYLIHTVYPFSLGEKERRSLAFNVKLRFV